MLDSSFLIWLYTFIKYLFRIYEGALIIYILSSWFPIARDNFILKFLEDICEPYLRIFRKILPPIAMVDFSPIIAIIVLGFIERLIYSLIFGVSLF